MKQYKNINDVEIQYRWDLEDILQNKSKEKLLEEIIKLQKYIILNKENKYKTLKNYLVILEKSNEAEILTNKLKNYISNKLSENIFNNEMLEFSLKVENIFEKLEIENGSEIERISKYQKRLRRWSKSPKLLTYKRFLIHTLDSLKHKLPKNVEEYIIKTSFSIPSPYEIFNIVENNEIDYGQLLKNGKKIKITNANLSSLFKDKNKDVRKQARIKFAKAYLKRKNLLSRTLFDQFKLIVSEAKSRNYQSTIDMLTYDDRISKTFIKKFIENIRKNLNSFKPFYKYKKQFYKFKFKEKMTKYDQAVDLVKFKSKYTIEEAKEIIINALSIFGDDYIKIIKKAFNERWIDFMNVDNKKQGAYSIGDTYGISKKYILMNFDETLDSVYTLAHELGHSMHSYYSDLNNPIENSQYEIILAEIASNVNELVLSNYLINNAKDEKEKFYILEKMIDNFIQTVNKQIEWAEYELNLYESIEQGVATPSWEYISKLFYENAKKYHNEVSQKKFKYNEEDLIGAIYVPHYYMGFYIYKYAIGYFVAQSFVKNFAKQDNIKKYINNFLSSGNKYWPLDLLKLNEIDLEDQQVYQDCFNYIEQIIEKWIQSGKKIFSERK
ncbi:M3 family oligoendopeptidase [Mycoplasma phocimorsus]|uniref:M3 family oligoendopeptidase n=1 Tax=Mycoplasma phocimorsus TaxID=3045839 RepID=UPI0024BF4130|nr:M3 family oligoendopeptidase [Mycoplasma phocimorsus]MDJ1646935.1 M3 family oligoendopeptidase [Mycoplasma phocimorsus]